MTSQPSDVPQGADEHAETDTDHSPEFRTARKGLVEFIDDCIGDVAIWRKQDGRRTPSGTYINDAPMIIREPVDGANTGDSYERATVIGFGIALLGDGETIPFELQAVQSFVGGDYTEVIEARGSDPQGSSEVVASFSISDYVDSGLDRHFGCRVMRDGTVRHSFTDDEGVYRTTQLSTVEDLAALVADLNFITTGAW